MPQIESWLRLPAAIRDHLVERMRDRNINLDLNRLRIWIDLKPNVPEEHGSKISGRSNFAARSVSQDILAARIEMARGESL
jgi:hypothetical protein